jgi:hypothetical protein
VSAGGRSPLPADLSSGPLQCASSRFPLRPKSGVETFGKVLGFVSDKSRTLCRGSDHEGAASHKAPPLQGLSHAPEWTRTTTDQMVHKALNPIRAAWMGAQVSDTSILRASEDASHASDGTTFVRLLSRSPVLSAHCLRRTGPSTPPGVAASPLDWPPRLRRGSLRSAAPTAFKESLLCGSGRLDLRARDPQTARSQAVPPERARERRAFGHRRDVRGPRFLDYLPGAASAPDE